MEQKKSKPSLGHILLIVLAAVAAFAVAVSAAYIKLADVNNNFSPADSIDPEVVEKFEEFDKTLKKDVYFEVGETEYPVYVRVALVFTWQNEDGIVYFSKPVEATPILGDGDEIIGYSGDYTIDLNIDADDDWMLGDDGFYYYKYPVQSDDPTTILINECRQVNDAPADGYTLSVEIIVQTVQAVGFTDEDNENGVIPAYQDAWHLYKEQETVTTD